MAFRATPQGARTPCSEFVNAHPGVRWGATPHHVTPRCTMYIGQDVARPGVDKYVLRMMDVRGDHGRYGENSARIARLVRKMQQEHEGCLSGVVNVLGVSTHGLHYYIVEEFAQGHDMYRKLCNFIQHQNLHNSPFGPADWYGSGRKLARSFLEAVAEMHSHGLYHLDLSLENVMVVGQHQAKLIDLESMVHSDEEVIPSSRHRATCWKVNYTPAPIALSIRKGSKVLPKELDLAAIDAYTVGICLFVFFVGNYPYRDVYNDEYWQLFRHGSAYRASHMNVAWPIDARLADLIDKLLGIDLTKREGARRSLPVADALRHSFFHDPVVYVPAHMGALAPPSDMFGSPDQGHCQTQASQAMSFITDRSLSPFRTQTPQLLEEAEYGHRSPSPWLQKEPVCNALRSPVARYGPVYNFGRLDAERELVAGYGKRC